MTAITRPFPREARLLAALLLVVLSPTARAAGDAPDADVPETDAGTSPGLDFKTERVVVFKDGYGLFVKSASGYADA